MNLKIKICGMKYPENIGVVGSLLPDMLGFIFYDRSARFVSDTTIFDSLLLPQSVKKIGVFVNEPIENILRIVSDCKLDGVQLHGNESVEICDALRQHGLLIIKAISVSNIDDLAVCEQYHSHVDWLLFDTKTAAHGGSGKRFDWSVLSHYRGNTGFFLSGGISDENAPEILALNHPLLAGVDLNSRFEISPGLKDLALLSSFIKKINS
jgi:phosphoribosylanthranilate isomerase